MKLLVSLGLLAAAAIQAATPEQDVKDVLVQQTADWNRGDLEAFVRSYSPDCVFVSKAISRGSAQVLANYRKNYPTKAKMGTLEFPDLEVSFAGPEYASVLGHFHLARTTDAGGEASGVFTLLLRKTPAGWKIILDHTS